MKQHTLASSGTGARLVDDAARGSSERPQPDDASWTALVARHDRLLRGVARRYRLNASDVDDVLQNTWVRAWRHLDQLRDADAIEGWLVVTVRREAMRLLQRDVREVLAASPVDASQPAAGCVEDAVLERERDACLHAAVGRLPARQRDILRGLLASPEPSYGAVAARLGMPRGSVGPTRERAFARLRLDSALQHVVHG